METEPDRAMRCGGGGERMEREDARSQWMADAGATRGGARDSPLADPTDGSFLLKLTSSGDAT